MFHIKIFIFGNIPPYNMPSGWVQSTQDGRQLNEIHQLLGCVHDGNCVPTCHKENAYALLDTNKETVLEVKAQKLSVCSCLAVRMLTDSFNVW